MLSDTTSDIGMSSMILPHTAKRKLDDIDGMAAVRLALEALRLEIYADAFEEAGYDDLAFIQSMGQDDLKTLGEVVQMKPGHFHKLCDWLPDLDTRIAALSTAIIPQASTANSRTLHLSCKSPTGYTNVFKHPSGCFKARQPGGTRIIGSFETAIDAAVAYADAVAERKCESKGDEGDDRDEQQEPKLIKMSVKQSSWPTVAGQAPPRDALPPDVADDVEASEVYAAIKRLKAEGVERKLSVHGYEMSYHLRGNAGAKAVGGYWVAKAAPIQTRGGDVITFPGGQVLRRRFKSTWAPLTRTAIARIDRIHRVCHDIHNHVRRETSDSYM